MSILADIKRVFSRAAALRVRRRAVVAGLGFALAMSSALALGAGSGALDKTFGQKGLRTVRFGSSFDGFNDVDASRKSRILLAGSDSEFAHFAIVALKPNGSFDHSFSHDGVETLTFLHEYQGEASTVMTDKKGRILVAGDFGGRHEWRFGVARLKSNGALDKSFGDGGKQYAGFPGEGIDSASAMLDTEGRVVVAGDNEELGTGDEPDYEDIAIARFTTGGKLDKTFSDDGAMTMRLPEDSHGTDDSYVDAVAPASHSRILFAGYRGQKPYVGRLRPDGTLDPSFAHGGLREISFGLSRTGYLRDLAPVGNKIYTLGTSFVGRSSRADPSVVRLNENGGVDKKFANHGVALPKFKDSSILSYHFALDRHRRILVVGCKTGAKQTDHYHADIFRLKSSGAPDRKFGKSGLVAIHPGKGGSCAFGVDVDSRGRPIAAGEFSKPGPDTDMFAARFRP